MTRDIGSAFERARGRAGVEYDPTPEGVMWGGREFSLSVHFEGRGSDRVVLAWAFETDYYT